MHLNLVTTHLEYGSFRALLYHIIIDRYSLPVRGMSLARRFKSKAYILPP